MTDITDFNLKIEPKLPPAIPRPEPQHDPKTLEIMNGVVLTARERDELRHQVHELQDRIDILARELEHERDRFSILQKAHDTVCHDRDFYLRHGTALAVRLNDIASVIDTAVAEAKEIAELQVSQRNSALLEIESHLGEAISTPTAATTSIPEEGSSQ